MSETAIRKHQPMQEILTQWPESIEVFLAFKMNCIGCYMNSFDTLEDALRVHGLPTHEVLTALNEMLAAREDKNLGHNDE